MSSLVSIIIPCYNSEKYVTETIQSALDQTYANCEIIVIDDGSTDGSLEVIKSFGDKIHWETGPNKGGCAARNQGLSLAKGNYIQFLDADDLLESRKIELQMVLAGKNGPDCLISSSWRRFRNDPGDHTFPLEGVEMPESPEEWLIQKYSGKGMMVTHAWLTPVALIGRTNGWNEQLTRDQDGEFFDHLVTLSSGISHCSQALAYYRIGDSGSVSARADRKSFESVLSSMKNGSERLLAICDSPEACKACAFHSCVSP